MKKFLLIPALFIIMSAHAQNARKDANGNYTAVSRRDTTAGKDTGHTFTDKDGKKYNVYVSPRGKLYYYRTSKAGNVYKSYIKVNVD